MARRRFTLEIECETPAFGDHPHDLAIECNRIASMACGAIWTGKKSGALHDIHGNKVGEWRLADGEE